MNIPAVLRDSGVNLGIIESAGSGYQPMTNQAVREALGRSLWPDMINRTVFDLVKPGESTCIVVSDHTRETAAHAVLPGVVDGLLRKGCSAEDLFILIASGIHRAPTPKETISILGPDIFKLFEGRIFRHDADDQANLATVGKTRRGHTVRINKKAIEADRLILIGTASYHYHAGFGGGRKSLVPGIAARETIAYSHSLTIDPLQDRIHPQVDLGILDGNPVAEEIMDGAKLCEPDLIINTVLTPTGTLVGVFTGDLELAHQAACRMEEEVSRVDIAAAADIVVASAGSALNWIQSHKALVNAHRAIKKGGKIILLAPCPEGLGDERFRYWVTRPDVGNIFAELRRSVEVLGQTALSTRTRGQDAILVTRMSAKDTVDLHIRTAPDLDSAAHQAIDECRQRGQTKPSYYVMPEARHSVPFVKKQSTDLIHLCDYGR